MTAPRVTIRLTAREARILWSIVDGALDAGACADGLTDEENKVLRPIHDKLLFFVRDQKQAK